jgi:lipid-binding SYLF domain-containing protein
MRTEILTFARSRGLFAGVSLEGSVLKPDHEANAFLYGREVDPIEVLRSPGTEVPELAERFVSELNRVAWRPPSAQAED